MARAMATAGLAPPPRASTPRFRLGPSRPPPSRRPRRVVVRAKSARYPASVRAPMPLPEAVATGLSCAVSGSRAALASPSDAWKPLTAATLVTALALESAGFFAAYALLHPDDDAGVVSSVVGTLALAATDVAWLLVARPRRRRRAAGPAPPRREALLRRHASHRRAGTPRGAPADALLASPGLGLRGLGVAAGRGQSLGAFAAAAPAASSSPSPRASARYSRSRSRRGPRRTRSRGSSSTRTSTRPSSRSRTRSASWDNRAALVSFAAPFAAALAVPVVGPTRHPPSRRAPRGSSRGACWRWRETKKRGRRREKTKTEGDETRRRSFARGGARGEGRREKRAC